MINIAFISNLKHLAAMAKSKIKGRLLAAFAMLLALLIWKPALLWHIPISKPETLKAEVEYRFFNVNLDGFCRAYFENWVGNRCLDLNNNKINYLYIDSNTFKNLLQEPIFEGELKKYSIVATFSFSKALFGGYTLARVIDTTHVPGRPRIHK